MWAFPILRQEGYRYSSSINPIRHDLYGMPDAPRVPFRPDPDGVMEIPMTTVRLMGRNWPCSGGGYFRLLPTALYRAGLGRVNRHDRQPGIFYFHPWEIDPDQPRIANAGWKSRLRHYTNLSRMAGDRGRTAAGFRLGPDGPRLRAGPVAGKAVGGLSCMPVVIRPLDAASEAGVGPVRGGDASRHVLPSRRLGEGDRDGVRPSTTHYSFAERDGAITGVLPLGRVKTLLFGDTLISNPFCVYGGPLAADAESEAALIGHAESPAAHEPVRSALEFRPSGAGRRRSAGLDRAAGSLCDVPKTDRG